MDQSTDKRRHIHPHRILLAVLSVCFGLSAAHAAGGDWPQFRGPERDGKAYTETDLLDKWPEDGPEQVWVNDELGFGFASAAVSGDRIYTTGLEDEKGYIYALDLDGNLKWKTSYGKGWSGARRGTRTTPTVHNGNLYIMTGHAKAACYDAKTGEEVWAVDTKEKFGARNIRWGITESPLVMEDKAIFTPGGKNAGVVALDPQTGETVWVCEEVNDKSGYCSPFTIQRGGKTIIVQLMGSTFVGIRADNGKLLWRAPRKPTPDYHIQAVHPVYKDGLFYLTSGYGGRRGQMFKLNEAGTGVTRGWSDSELDCHHGGLVLYKGHVYGASHANNRNKWLCMNLKTGEVAAKTGAVGKGAVIFADGMLYTYGKRGRMGLVNPDPDNFHMISSFRVKKGRGPHWAHPSIADGRLYLRHGAYMFAYDIATE